METTLCQNITSLWIPPGPGGERGESHELGHLLALELFSNSPVPSHCLGGPQTCPTTPQFTVPAVTPISNSQSPSLPSSSLSPYSRAILTPTSSPQAPALSSITFKYLPTTPSSCPARVPRPIRYSATAVAPSALPHFPSPTKPLALPHSLSGPFPSPVLHPTAPVTVIPNLPPPGSRDPLPVPAALRFRFRPPSRAARGACRDTTAPRGRSSGGTGAPSGTAPDGGGKGRAGARQC